MPSLAASASAPVLARSGTSAGSRLLGRRRPSKERAAAASAGAAASAQTVGLGRPSSSTLSQASSITARGMTMAQMRRRRLERLVEATRAKLDHQVSVRGRG